MEDDNKIYLFDTTLRDGQQITGVNFSVSDKMTIAKSLDELGIDYIEGGWPGANPTDNDFFSRDLNFNKSKFTAFGMTRRPGRSADNDPGLNSLINSNAHTICLVGKSSAFQVKNALGISEDGNISMLSDSFNYLNNKISFIRVVPWNWVSKKGTAGDVQYMNNDWFYKWSNNGNSDLDREYTPMAWGKGAADDDNDIEIIKSKYKSTHVLGFNEPDDCNGQSGQYGDMCVVDTSLTYYKNLLKSGLRMVSPACRQGAAFDWLNEFNSKAIEENIRIDVIAVHWYDWASNPENSPNANPQDVYNRFVNYLESVYELYGLPIWITEFNANRHRNEWVHRQFLQLALPFLEETNYIERYSFFPPTTQVANFFDSNNNFTQIGELYNGFVSTKSITESRYVSSSNLDSENYDFELIECNPDDEFLSVNSLGLSEEIIIYPNPSNDYININYDEEIWKLQIINMNGEKIDVKPSKSSIDISFLSKGIYILNFNNNFIKFVKN